MSEYDVYGIGNALVDTEFTVDDTFLRDSGIAKGHMTLVDQERLLRVLADLDGITPRRTSGGSAANTMIAVQGFGARTFYSCKVAGDETGAFFVRDLNASGVRTRPHGGNGGVSGQCLVLITPDAERSMNTCLGISEHLGRNDIDEAALRASRGLYIEGYLASSPTGRNAAIACREIAEEAGVRTSLTLSDPSMVEIFRDGLVAMLGNGVDQLFCNEEEALDWAGTDRLDVAVAELEDIAAQLNVTLGARGSLVVDRGRRAEVPGFAVTPVDTTGAGDIYAGACLYGWCADMPADVAARFANFAASRLVTQYGARLAGDGSYGKLLAAFPRT